MKVASARRGAARYAGKLATSAASALLTVAIGLVVLDLPIGPARFSTPAGTADFGFSAHYTIPDPDPERATCGTMSTMAGYGHKAVPWAEGPHAGFDALDPTQVARESLAWFEESPESATWLPHESVYLELEYSSGDSLVTARIARGAEHAWEEQLRAWFERLPPSSASERPEFSGDCSWEVVFGEHGEVQGWVPTEEEAIALLKNWVPEPEGASFFAHPTFELGQSVKVEPHTMNCYRVETTQEIDDLPARLHEQRADWESRHPGG